MIEVTIDGRKVYAREGETILKVAKRAGIYIPTLCHNDSVKPYSACRLCLVEVERKGRTKLVTACDYPIQEPVEIRTNTPRIQRDRRVTLELLMARTGSPAELADLAEKIGVEDVRFKVQNFDDCVMCGLCVRVCDEVVGAHAIGFESRGPARRVVPPFDQENEACIACGACAQVCPVNIIDVFERAGIRELPRWHKKAKLVACRVCGRYFATEEELAMIKAKTNMPDDLLHTCPDCRQYNFKV